MSIDEIIRAWKDGEDSVQQGPTPESPAGEKEKPAPENPAGEQELSDDDLLEVQGGVLPDSCNHDSC